jgi:hypothetical protein
VVIFNIRPPIFHSKYHNILGDLMFKIILCATDLNITSSEAVKKAVQLAHQYGSKIIMLNVHEEFMSQLYSFFYSLTRCNI